MSIKFSIIIPCYNAEPYVGELLECLDKQMKETDEVEVILIDDGSEENMHSKYQLKYTWLRVFRQENQGCSKARNVGIDRAKGEAIGFIDADDLVSDNYIKFVLEALKNKEWDYIDLSWKSLENNKYTYKLKSDKDSLPNPSASTRIFKKEFIGAVRFPENKDAAEDEHFTRHLNLKRGKHICATDYMYYYRINVPDSGSKRYVSGRTKTKRIAYYFKMITEDMTWLIDEVREEDKLNEVYILTFKNMLPELEKYAQIMSPTVVNAHEMRGEPNRYLNKIIPAKKAQIVIYAGVTHKVDGIATFIYDFIRNMSKHYDILVLYDQMDEERIMRMVPYVPVEKNNPRVQISCDTLITNRIHEKIPRNIEYKQSIQMVHACRCDNPWELPKDRDKYVYVSKVVQDDWGAELDKSAVINNMTYSEAPTKALLLVTASRLDTDEKGEDRMKQLARIMDNQKIPYIWLYFSNKEIRNTSQNLIKMDPVLNIMDYVSRADYLVQLSDTEGFCYSMVEALDQGIPVITTPLPVLKEIKVVDKENAYIIPFDLEGFDASIFLERLHPDYKYNNKPLITKWKKLLGNSKPTKDYYEPDKLVKIKIIRRYEDTILHRIVEADEILEVNYLRATKIQNANFGIIVE